MIPDTGDRNTLNVSLFGFCCAFACQPSSHRKLFLQGIVRVYVREHLDTRFPWKCQEIEKRDAVLAKLEHRIRQWTRPQMSSHCLLLVALIASFHIHHICVQIKAQIQQVLKLDSQAYRDELSREQLVEHEHKYVKLAEQYGTREPSQGSRRSHQRSGKAKSQRARFPFTGRYSESAFHTQSFRVRAHVILAFSSCNDCLYTGDEEEETNTPQKRSRSKSRSPSASPGV